MLWEIDFLTSLLDQTTMQDCLLVVL